MEPEELMELHERVERDVERKIGVTMAVLAALLAVVTLMGHRLHTEEVVLQTKTADGWAYYQAKNTRAQMYATDAQLAALQGSASAAVAAQWNTRADKERRDADDIRRQNEELDRETQMSARRATLFDASEVFLEVALVLCSVALLTGALRFWYVSFVGTAIAVAVGGYAALTMFRG
jgi:hypothetical protein